MREYVTEAIVLNREENGDLDSRVSLFTRQFGKLIAKAKSARKITSKLSAHLEPGTLTQVRLVEKNGLNITDALSRSRINIGFPDLYKLNMILGEAEPDRKLWQILKEEKFSWKEVLKILGWDPDFAACGICGKEGNLKFFIETQEFFCRACLKSEMEQKLIYL